MSPKRAILRNLLTSIASIAYAQEHATSLIRLLTVWITQLLRFLRDTKAGVRLLSVISSILCKTYFKK